MVRGYENALKRLWDGLCDVYVYKEGVDEATGRTIQKAELTVKGEPCRVSYSTLSATTPTSEAFDVGQVIKLFIAKDVDIPEGSKLVITQEGRTEAYRRAGKAAVYSVHQEIVLELEKEWA